MNMVFLSNMQTRLILFYLTVICNLATCSSNASSKMDDETNLVSGCRYTYPSYINPYTPLMKIDSISCRNMLTSELPFYENVTAMELINVPQVALNETELPNAVRSGRVDLRELRWTKSHIKFVQSIPMASLVELDLSWNVIEEVRQGAFKKLVHLTQLNVSHNNIESLPDYSLAECFSLRVLSLAHNQLTSIPRDISQHLRHLETLDVSNNQLRHLEEDSFRKLHHLQNLNLAYNRLNQLPIDVFQTPVNLKHLSLEANLLFNIEPDTFHQQMELMVLNLGHNPLLALPSPLLLDNNTLLVLTISHTNIARLNSAVLQNLRQLRNLYLTDNHHLQNLPNDTFDNAGELKVIHLQNNNFTQLPYSILNTEPDELLLDGNPWHCDCSTQWIVFWAHDRHTTKKELSGRVGSDNTRRDSLRVTAYCNATRRDLVEALRKLRCKPNILRMSPVRYASLEAEVKLVCISYANPTPRIKWVTPKGVAHIKLSSEGGHIEGASSNSPDYALSSNTGHETVLNANVMAQNHEHLHRNGDFVIKQMSRDDAGEYTCWATNEVGASFRHTRLFVDPSIMQRIKTGSLISGFLWVNTFLLFSVVYLLIRRYSQRAKQEKRKRRMHENMDIYKSQQISRLRERCKNQMNRIKNNCFTQVEWMKDNYTESMKTLQDHRASYLSSQYNEQMVEIREYYLIQMQKVREHFDQQRKFITEFSINRVGSQGEAEEPDTLPPTNELVARVENGTTSGLSVAADEDDVYRYNESIKSEIRRLTSLRNLHEAFATESESKFGSSAEAASSCNEAPGATIAASKYDLYSDTISNGKLRMAEEEGDEKTSMLHEAKISR